MDTKPFWQSVTFWGSVIALIAGFFPKIWAAFGVDVPTAANYVVMIIGFVITLIGRLRASTQLTLK